MNLGDPLVLRKRSLYDVKKIWLCYKKIWMLVEEIFFFCFFLLDNDGYIKKGYKNNDFMDLIWYYIYIYMNMKGASI